MKKQTLLALGLIISFSINAYLVEKAFPEVKLAVSALQNSPGERFLTGDKAVDFPLWITSLDPVIDDSSELEIEEPEICDYDKPEKPVYEGKVTSIIKSDNVEPGELFKVKVYVDNTGNIPWFSDATTCKGEPSVRLAKINPEDGQSIFWTDYRKSYNGWLQNDFKNRVEILQHHVSPGQTATFIFWVKAPTETDVYREVFSLRVGEETWFSDPKFTLDVEVGDVAQELKDRMKVVFMSARASELIGQKSIEVDLSDQKMFLKVGDKVIKHYSISSGKPSTPTPTGNYKILFKQPTRIGGAWPHYIMPHWQSFRPDGYGFHALPSLKTDGGKFWTEAFNHIGRPVSHGCIRLLPWDAEEYYSWTEVGTPVEVHK